MVLIFEAVAFHKQIGQGLLFHCTSGHYLLIYEYKELEIEAHVSHPRLRTDSAQGLFHTEGQALAAFLDTWLSAYPSFLIW